MCAHRFIWECCNSTIPKNYEIDHIDNNPSNNNISNLRCITINENRQRRDLTNFLKIQKIAHTLKRFIKSINTETNEVICFPSKSQCAKYFDVSPALIYLICENKAKIAKGKYKFEYIDENDVINLIKIPHGNNKNL